MLYPIFYDYIRNSDFLNSRIKMLEVSLEFNSDGRSIYDFKKEVYVVSVQRYRVYEGLPITHARIEGHSLYSFYCEGYAGMTIQYVEILYFDC